MATTRGWSLRGNINRSIDYILDLKNSERKTENGYYTITNLDVPDPALAGYQMRLKSLNRRSDYSGYHFQFSLPPGEGNEEICMLAAKEWIESISDNKAEYVIAVHNNCKHIHAHIICNYFLSDGKPWKVYWKRDKHIFREAADNVCKNHGLSVLDKTAEKGLTYAEWLDKERADSNHIILKKVLDDVISKVSCFEDLENYLSCLGFKIENKKVENKNHLNFTANKKMISQQPDGSYLIRIPYKKEYIRVEEDEFKWIGENQETAKIIIPIDKKVLSFKEDGSFLGQINVTKLKDFFEEKSQRGRLGLRISIPNSKKVIRTKSLSRDKDYSYEGIKKQIAENGRLATDANIMKVINNPKNYDFVIEATRDLYDRADVSAPKQCNPLYKSVKQENFYNWKWNQIQRRLEALDYSRLMEKDRQNLPVLKSRVIELKNEIHKCYETLRSFDKEVEEMVLDRIENNVQITDAELASLIKETKKPLEEKIRITGEQIEQYQNHINNIEAYAAEKEKQRMYTRVKVR